MTLRGTPLTPEVGDALVALAMTIRPDWHYEGTRAGIRSALARTQPFTLPELAHAIAHAAGNPTIRTPQGIALDGPHWSAPRDPHSAPNVRPITCPQCGQVHTKAEGCKRPEPAGDPAAHRETFRTLLAEARSGLCAQHHAKPCAECAPKEDR